MKRLVTGIGMIINEFDVAQKAVKQRLYCQQDRFGLSQISQERRSERHRKKERRDERGSSGILFPTYLGRSKETVRRVGKGIIQCVTITRKQCEFYKRLHLIDLPIFLFSMTLSLPLSIFQLTSSISSEQLKCSKAEWLLSKFGQLESLFNGQILFRWF